MAVMIQAFIRPNKLEVVKLALAKLGLLGLSATECKGFGRRMGHTRRYRGPKNDVGFVPKIKIEVCVKDSEQEAAIQAIIEAARSGAVGDGKIFVHPMTEVIRIRTGEKQDAAL